MSVKLKAAYVRHFVTKVRPAVSFGKTIQFAVIKHEHGGELPFPRQTEVSRHNTEVAAQKKMAALSASDIA